MEIIPPGTKCKIANHDAIINTVAIQANNLVKYEIVYWDGNTRKTELVFAHELDEQDYPKTRIGFVGDV